MGQRFSWADDITIPQHLERCYSLSPEQRNVENFLLENGTFYTVGEETNNYHKYKDMVKRSRRSRCYSNSIWANSLYGFEYWEGLYLTDTIPLPIDHAFNVRDGLVYDFTRKNVGFMVYEWAGFCVPLGCVAEAMRLHEVGIDITPLRIYLKEINYVPDAEKIKARLQTLKINSNVS